MDLIEYNKIKNLPYEEYCNYLQNKYSNFTLDLKLFKHHYYEKLYPNLSNPDNLKEAQLLYLDKDLDKTISCDYLEHLLLHILIGEETDGRLGLGIGGAISFIIPEIEDYLKFGIAKYDLNYYSNIDLEVFNLLKNRAYKLVTILNTVLDHNYSLYLEVKDNLNFHNKSLVILGPGLGKTTIALQYLREYNLKALVIVPNILIKSNWEEYKNCILKVETIQNYKDKYNLIDYSNYDIVIIDEIHHLGDSEEFNIGAKKWVKPLKFLLDKGIKVLGLTATPERTDGIDIRKYFKPYINEGYSLEDGIEKKLIHPFSYITALYNTEEIREEYTHCTSEELKGQLDLALNSHSINNIISKYLPEGKRKGICFIKNIKDEEEAYSIIRSNFPKIEIRTLYSMRVDNDENKEWFKNTDEGFIVAINMISEGAHYDNVNTILMLRKTNSYQLFTQQLGRIITLYKNKNPNAIVFDLVNNIKNIKFSNKGRKPNLKIHSITSIIDTLKNTEDYISNQIIIADESIDIVNAIKNIKRFESNIWLEWEDDLIRNNKNKFKKEKDLLKYLILLLPRHTLEGIKTRIGNLGLRTKFHSQIKINNIPSDKVDLIKNNYRKGIKFLSSITGYDNRFLSLVCRRLKLNIKPNIYNDITEEESEYIRLNIEILGPKKLSEILKNKWGSTTISNYALKKFNLKKIPLKHRFTKNQKEYIQNNFFKFRVTELASNLNLSESLVRNYLKDYIKFTYNIENIDLRYLWDSLYWDEEKINKLKGIYCSQGLEETLKIFSDIPKFQVIKKVENLKLVSGKANKTKSSIKVKCIETGKIYNSKNQAIKETGINFLYKMDVKKNSFVGGYHWEYIK